MVVENNPYPQDARVRAESRALVDAGYQVTVIAQSASDQPWRDRINGVSVYRFPAPPPMNGAAGYVLEYAYAFVAIFALSLVAWQQEGFDAVHAHNPPDILVVLGAFYKLMGKRFVFDHHDLAPEMYAARFRGRARPILARVLAVFEKWSCQLADHVIAANDSYRLVEIERDGVGDDRITVVRNGPDLKRLRPVSPDPELRRRGRVLFGYVGVMGTQDGVDYLLRALRCLLDRGRSDWYCVLVGTGPSWHELQELTADLGLTDHVWFTGTVSDEVLVRCLSSADICVDPDPSNPFNDRSTMIKVMEYMALGKPVVAFDLPEHRRSAQQAALYARANDERDFARCLTELMDDPARRAAMGQFGRARVEEALAWRHSVVNLLSAYAHVLPAHVQQQQAAPVTDR